MTPTDRAALELAVATARKDPAEARRIDDRLERGRDWIDIGKSASFHCQIESLHLQPWQTPPCYADVDARRASDGGAELLRKMLALGVSRWHPNPARECARVEAEAKRLTPAK
jgi:hypothetical protein